VASVATTNLSVVGTPFYREGTGWVYEPPKLPIRLRFDYVEVNGIEGRAQLRVESLEINDVITSFSANLSSEQTRERYVKTIVKKACLIEPGQSDEVSIALERSFMRVMEAAREPLEVYVTDGVRRKPQGVTWLLDGLIMQGTINCLLAAPETGKSTQALGIGIAHAAGRGIFGRAIQRGVTYFLDWEGDLETFEERLQKISAGMGIDPPAGIIYERHSAPLRYVLHHVARTIDRHHVTLLIIDAVTTAAGSMGDRGYEAVAVDLEVALRSLPVGVTVLLVDHVDGETVKGNTVPIKGRGSTRKLEFVRNQWSLVLDKDAQANRDEHIVGWVHTKKNRVKSLPSFGVQLLHEDDAIRFDMVDPSMVGPLVHRGTVAERMRSVIEENGAALSIRALAMTLLGREDDSAQQQIRNNVKRDNGRLFTRLPGGFIDLKIEHRKPAMRVVSASGDEPEELPF
jgi:hypothetical protein